MQFLNLPYRRFYETLDACKAADYVLFVLSPTTEVDPWGDLLLRSLQAQGIPDVVTCVSTTDYPPDPNTPPVVVKSLVSIILDFVRWQKRVFDLDSTSDRLNAVRALCDRRPSEIRWREGRPWLLAEDVQWHDGVLGITGIVRGATLSANRLVHLPNYGDFQIHKVGPISSDELLVLILMCACQIMSAALPRPVKGNATTMEVEPVVLSEPDPTDADSLVSTNEPETMHDEQTWPTEEEMHGATGEENGAGDAAGEGIPDARKGTTPKRVKRIPKGMSEYQASWIVDDDDYEDEEEQGDGSDGPTDGEVEDDEEMVEVPEPEEDMESRRSVAFKDLDLEEEAKQCVLRTCPYYLELNLLSDLKSGNREHARRKKTRRFPTR